VRDLTKFSAIICLYRNNDASEVRVALESAILNQSYPPSELVAVFDGPTPHDVEDVVDEMALYLPIQKVRFAENRGHGPARAAGIEAVMYEWAAMIDADDISFSNRFEHLLAAINEFPEAAVIGGGMIEFYDTVDGRIMGAPRVFPKTPQEIRRVLQTRSPVAQTTAMLRVAAIRTIGNYQFWFNNEDYHLWIRLIKAGYDIHNIPQPVVLVRTSHDMYRRRGGLRYWWNEVRLQLFSFNQGTTTFWRFLFGSGLRFIVQVLMPGHFRKMFYRKFLRG